LADFVSKLDDKPLARNNRNVAHKILNQQCALAPAVESILLVLASKIALQQNRPEAAQIDVQSNVGYRGKVCRITRNTGSATI
jgi:hypothetical protein